MYSLCRICGSLVKVRNDNKSTEAFYSTLILYLAEKPHRRNGIKLKQALQVSKTRSCELITCIWLNSSQNN